MQPPPMAKPPLGVVFDSDMGNNIDAALALALLYGLEGKGECRISGLSVTKSNLKSAAFCDVLARFYKSRPPSVGMADDGQSPEDTPMLAAPLSHGYPNQVHSINDTADPAVSIRNALTAQHPGHCVVVLAGPPTNLLRTLALKGVKDLIASNVRLLAVAGESNAPASLTAEWPSPIVVAPAEIGQKLPYPGASIEKDFAWAPHHPIVDAYRAFQAMPYDAPAPALAAALYAVRTNEGYFQLSAGKPPRLIAGDGQKEGVIAAYTSLISAQPVDRFPRRRT
jgi:hypothetical protein